MVPHGGGGQGRLSGEVSRQMIANLRKSKKFEKIISVIRFFNQQEGDVELCNMLAIMSGQGPIQEGGKIFHI